MNLIRVMPVEGREIQMLAELGLTNALAIALGLYMLAAGVGGVLDRARWDAILNNLADQPALSFIAGIVTFSLGVVIVLFHNDWSGPLAGIVSLVGWLAVLEGLVLIAYPGPLFDFAKKLMAPSLMNAFMSLTFALGALLLLSGLAGAAGVG